LTESADVSYQVSQAHRVIGIDLGTTSCTVAVWDGSRVVVLPPTPSVVGQNRAGQVVVGRIPAAGRESAITGIKRVLGSGEQIRFRGRTYRTREICAFLLIELKRQAEAFVGGPVYDAVITVPSSSGETQRRALREAAGLAQLNVRRLLDDTVAAAAGFGADRPGTYAIYDLGGGTFDAAIVRIGPGGVEVLGTAGDPRLGGDDFDDRIAEFALRQIRERHHVDLSRDGHIRQRICWEAEIRKRELSVAESVTLDLPVLTATVSAAVPLTRRGFEAMIEPDVDRSLDYLGAAMLAAGVGRAAIEQVLLSGGSTRIPLIRHRLARYFGLAPEDIRTDLDPDELNARGAGLIARDFESAPLFEGMAAGLLSGNLRLRAEMADPAPEPPVSVQAPDPAAPIPEPPAETPADYRRVAERSHDRLTAEPNDGHDALRTAYLGFVRAVLAADADARLAELGEALTAELVRDDGEAGTCP
jgi:molecular chaperone DnaK